MIKGTYLLGGMVSGPYTGEGNLKRAVVKKLETEYTDYKIFEIENGEKSPGMPDLLCVHEDKPAVFIELKHIGKDGMIRFRPQQPLWYRQNKDLKIIVLAWDSRYDFLMRIDPQEVVDTKKLYINVDTLWKRTKLHVRAFDKKEFL